MLVEMMSIAAYTLTDKRLHFRMIIPALYLQNFSLIVFNIYDGITNRLRPTAGCSYICRLFYS